MCKVTHQTSPVTIVFHDSLKERLNLLLFGSLHHPLILHLPWLLKHNPNVDWSMGSVLEWGRNFDELCFLDRDSPQELISEEVEKGDLHESPVSLMECIVSDGQVEIHQPKLQAIKWLTNSIHGGNFQCCWSEVPQDIVSVGSLEEETEPDENGPSAAFVVHHCFWRHSRARSTLIKSFATYRKAANRRTWAEPVCRHSQPKICAYIRST